MTAHRRPQQDAKDPKDAGILVQKLARRCGCAKEPPLRDKQAALTWLWTALAGGQLHPTVTYAPGAPPLPVVDCVIVGGGPVGLLTAVLLGQAGLPVSVVERWPERYPLPRACTIDHEALRILQAAGLMADHAGLFEPSPW